ncbi:hypothetical protein DPN68_02025 [Flavobacterium tibetense]|uniref:Uncharacterized protein n=1 Tax=Flavobacterium tibetense TaxID=2233533 RepID=A0A365P4D0_9FLAO|nr:hypothetical protein DPN68_02025 [Flavobacterium tibetense]
MSKKIILKDFYQIESVVFISDIDFSFSDKNFLKSLEPSLEELIDGEKFLFNNYYEFESKVNKHFKLKDEVPKKYKKPKRVVKKFKKHRRQYFGYINKNGDHILRIHLLKPHKKHEYDDESWKEYMFFSSSTQFYLINLTQRKFIYKVVGLDENGNPEELNTY